MANKRDLSMSSLLYNFNSRCKMAYSFLIFSLVAGTKNNKVALRSIWRRKRVPKPFPSWAPSIIPGISAITKDW